MSVMHIAATGATQATVDRAIKALQDAGVEVYRAWIEPEPIGLNAVPDRAHLLGKSVLLELNPWAQQGPREGVFAGQDGKSLAVLAKGGGRFTYLLHEVAEVTPA